jgi:hypothetical protein
MQNYIDTIEQNQIKAQATSPQQMEHQNALHELRSGFRAFRSGQAKAPPDAQAFIKRGIQPAEIAHEWKQSRTSPLEAALGRIPVVEVARAYQVADDHHDDKDMALARRVLMKRLSGGAWQKLKPPDRAALAPLLRDILVPKKKEEEAHVGA